MAQNLGVTIGAESGILARWLLVAASGRTAPLTFLQGVTLYLVMGDGGSLHERSDWDDQVDDVIHNLYQPPLHRELVRGSFPAPHHHDPNEMQPNFAFWVMVAAPSCQHNGMTGTSVLATTPSLDAFAGHERYVFGASLCWTVQGNQTADVLKRAMRLSWLVRVGRMPCQLERRADNPSSSFGEIVMYLPRYHQQ